MKELESRGIRFLEDCKAGVLLYGAGDVGGKVMKALLKKQIHTHCFLDNNSKKSTHEGVKVFKLGETPAEISQNCPVVVTIFNPYVDMRKTMQAIHSAGWQNVISFAEILNFLPGQLDGIFWAEANYPYEEKQGEIATFRSLLDDAKSRELLDQVVEFRRTADYKLAPSPDMNTQYFALDIPAWRSPLRLVDCGAYDGDSVRNAMGKGLEIEAVALFEPDLDNFARIRDTLEPLVPAKIREAYTWPCGVYSTTTQLSFASGGGTASGLSSTGDTMIQCVALDDVLPGFQPNLIKMDIEGAEVEALKGAEALIRKHRPGLAICLYHKPSHLWEIPLLIDFWKLNYRFLLRCYAHSSFELVLYAIPL